MDILNLDQDRSLKPHQKAPVEQREPRQETTAPAKFFLTDSVRFDEPERSVASGNRVRIVVLHPNGIFRLGIHHAWSTSQFIHVGAVAANWSQLRLNSNIGSIRVGIFGLPNSLDGPDQPGIDQQLAELASISRDNPQIRWIVLANSLPNGYRKVIADLGVAGLVVGEFTTERLESVVMWVNMERSIGLDEPTDSLASTLPSALNDIAKGPNVGRLHPEAKPTIDSLGGATESPFHLDSRVSASLSELSEREQQVLDGLGEGKTNQQIADGLFLSVKTIETYRSRLKQKLGVTDRASMVAILNRHRAGF